MIGDVTPYIGKITSEHAIQPNYVATITAFVQSNADAFQVFESYPTLFDVDQATGSQLDILGHWIGVTRYVATPISGVYFSFDVDGLGFDQGIWLGPGDPTTGLIALPDDIYLLLLKAKIIANQWDGTIPGAYEAWNQLLASSGCQILIQDNGDMTMTLALAGAANNPTFRALFTGGYLDLRPAGVKITGYLYPSYPFAPFFGFDVESPYIAGFDEGAWATEIPQNVSIITTEDGFNLTTEDGQLIITEPTV